MGSFDLFYFLFSFILANEMLDAGCWGEVVLVSICSLGCFPLEQIWLVQLQES